MSTCCSINAEKENTWAPGSCPTCQAKGKKVELITLFQLIKRTFQKEIHRRNQYYFCSSKECEIVLLLF
ncbi:MAG: hypothetical protein HYS98_02530 [Deltaproteobacteria bacterium]|nr:hypothetical protein [Deltaproteobacteria bacterium]